MEQEIIVWNNIESVFILDDAYEYLNAPKWVDFSAPDEPPNGDIDAWFCNPDCEHSKTKDYIKYKCSSKVKVPISVGISSMLPFRDRNRRDAKLQKAEMPNTQSLKTEGSKSAYNFCEDGENSNPNLSTQRHNTKTTRKQEEIKSNAEKMTNFDEPQARNSSKQRLKSTFSARDLLAGKGVLNQITDFCSELKKIARRGSRNGSRGKVFGGVLGEKEERGREKGRLPLLEVKEEDALT